MRSQFGNRLKEDAILLPKNSLQLIVAIPVLVGKVCDKTSEIILIIKSIKP